MRWAKGQVVLANCLGSALEDGAADDVVQLANVSMFHSQGYLRKKVAHLGRRAGHLTLGLDHINADEVIDQHWDIAPA